MQKPAAPTIANFPNPFNLTTQVIFRVTGQDPYNTLHINLDMYDMLGRRVVTLVDGEMVPGTYTVTLLPPATTSSGTYFLYLRISTFLENYTQSRKIVLLK